LDESVEVVDPTMWPVEDSGSVGADDLDLDESGLAALGDVTPGVTRDAERIDRVGYVIPSAAKVVDGDGVGDQIAFWPAREPGVAGSLLAIVSTRR
jgi:hypothetical protein